MGESHIETSQEAKGLMKPLTADDLTLLGVPEEPKSSLKRIRDHHHRIAMMVAKGYKSGEIATALGMSLSRVSILKSDPAFRQLVEVYREKVVDIAFDALKEVLNLRGSIQCLALEVLRDRLEDDPDTFSSHDLLTIAGDQADRLGNPKLSRSQSVNVNLDLADALAAAQRRELRLSASPPPPEQVCVDAEMSGPDNSTPAELPAPTGGKT